jgi:poly-D-alanine transfer protein DltD
MNSQGDASQIRYDPQQTQIRHECEDLTLQNVKLKQQNKEYKELVQKMNASNLIKHTGESSRNTVPRQKYDDMKARWAAENKKYEKIRRYLKILPTRDEYEDMKDRLNATGEENSYLKKQTDYDTCRFSSW